MTKNIKKNNIPYRNILSNKKIKISNKKYKLIKYHKPNRLWYGLGYYWIDFYTNKWEITNNNKFNYNGYIYKLKIPSNLFIGLKNVNKKKILQIGSLKNFKLFEKKYGFFPKKQHPFQINGGPKYIKWNIVKKYYGGIEIKYNPFNDNNKYKPFWYSIFDVPSGCIWSNYILRNILLQNIF